MIIVLVDFALCTGLYLVVSNVEDSTKYTEWIEEMKLWCTKDDYTNAVIFAKAEYANSFI